MGGTDCITLKQYDLHGMSAHVCAYSCLVYLCVFFVVVAVK